jgi:Rrf2 family iron-sulfur cluster assembly transcriptional regulator
VGLQLTRGGEYAIRGMIYLAEHPVGEISSLRDISREQDIPESFLAKILQSLVHAGLVTSQRGARGGFSLARPAVAITAREIVEAVDGPVSLNTCVVRPEECQRSPDCRMHKVWVTAQERMMEVLGGVSLADLAPVGAAAL